MVLEWSRLAIVGDSVGANMVAAGPSWPSSATRPGAGRAGAAAWWSPIVPNEQPTTARSVGGAEFLAALRESWQAAIHSHHYSANSDPS